MFVANVPDDCIEPNWKIDGLVHEWKNYISTPLREIWHTFTPEQKAVIAQSAQAVADAEEWD